MKHATVFILAGLMIVLCLFWVLPVHSADTLTITSKSPAGNAVNVAAGSDITVQFAASVNGTTVSNNTFIVRGSFTGRIPGAFSVAGDTVTFSPAANFKAGEVVTVTITTGVRSIPGDTLAKGYTWQFISAAAYSPGTFADSGQAIGSSRTIHVSLGDVDGDGDIDCMAANSAANKIWLNDGNGVFTDSGQTLGTRYSQWIKLGDLDGDGDLDAFIANGSGLSDVNEVWLNDGAGVFTDTGQTLGSSNSQGLALGDVDGDGDLDAFVGNWGSPSRLWKNDGNAVFTDTGQILGNNTCTDVALGDLDNDGDLDVYIANGAVGQPNSVWYNDGSGIFYGNLILGDATSNEVLLGDLDGDGDLDASVINSFIKLWLNDGAGIFVGSDQVTDDGLYHQCGALGDLDGDADLDILTVNTRADLQPNTVWLNNGTAVFTSNGQLLSQPDTQGVAVADLDGDGDLDAFIALNDDSGSGANLVWLNTDITLPTMGTIAEAEGQYFNAAPVLSNFGFDDEYALNAGWYQADSWSGNWTPLFSGIAGASWDSDSWAVPGFGSLTEGTHTVYFKASDDAGNTAGAAGEWNWQFFKDTILPGDPADVTSPSHTVDTASSDRTIDVTWTDATDNNSGLDGYAILWDTDAVTVPPQVKNVEEGVETATSPALANGDSYYFHISSVDNAGNWQSTVHLGPFVIYVPPAGGGAGGGGGAAGITSFHGAISGSGRFVSPVEAESVDGKVTVTIPKDTVGKNRVGQPLANMTIKEKSDPPAAPADASGIGLTYDFGPAGATFDPAISVILEYDEDTLPEGVAEGSLKIANWDETLGDWVMLDCVVDVENNTITAQVSHFSLYTIISKPQPAAFSLAGLTVTPKEINAGEEVNVSVVISNTGDMSGSYTVIFSVNGEVIEEREITLDGGGSEVIFFTVNGEEAGSYSFNIDDLTGEYTVVDPAAEIEAAPQPQPSATPEAEAVPQEVTPSPSAPAQEEIPEPLLPEPEQKSNWPFWGTLIVIAGLVLAGYVVFRIVSG